MQYVTYALISSFQILITPISLMDSVEADLKRTGVNKWKIKAANRTGWRNDVGAVKAGTRL
jgi:hypothetical protein